MASNTVVPEPKPLTEEQFHAAFMCALARLVRLHGKPKVALWLGVSVRQLGNYGNGSLPSPDRIWNLLAHDASAHDELDAEFGQRNVPKDAVCADDPLTLSMITLAHQVAAAEDPGSHGGQKVTDHELLEMDEPLLRKVNRVTGTWLERLANLRKPRSVA